MMGRVMSMYSLAFTASGPLGFAWASVVASVWGPKQAILVGALACMALGVGCVLFLKPVRRLA